MTQSAAAAKIRAAGGIRSLTLPADAPLQLANGELLAPLTLAFETYGELNADASNAVLICHALDSDQFVAGANPLTGRPPWWPRIVGPGRPIDTNRFFVACANVIGGAMGSSGPASLAPDGVAYGLRFPAVTIADMVRAQAMLVEALGIGSLFLVMGPGMGGMQALTWASAYPRRVFACVTVASAARQPPQNIALSELGRMAVMADPDWRNGAYPAHGARPVRGLAVAHAGRQIAGLAASEVRARFCAARERERFVLDNQASRGHAERLDANSFLYVSRAADGFDLAADYGGRISNAFRDSTTRHCVFSFSNDWRYPAAEGRELARSLIAAGAETSYVELESQTGHDACFGEHAEFEAALIGFVDAAAAARGLPLHGGLF